MDINEAIEKLRSEKNDPTKPAFLIYSMMHSAHPTVIEVVEHQAAQMMVYGQQMVDFLGEAQKTEEGRRKLEEEFSKMMLRINSPGSNQGEEEEDG